MTHYTLLDFANQTACTHNRQCKVVPYGIDPGCNNYIDKAAGYLVYSTKIGNKNLRHLNRLIKEDKQSRHRHFRNRKVFNMSEEVLECVAVQYRLPKVACIKNNCANTY